MPAFTVAEAEHLVDSPHSKKLYKVLNLLTDYMSDRKQDKDAINATFASAFLEINREIYNYLNEEASTRFKPKPCYNSQKIDFFCFMTDTSDLVLNSLMNLHAALGHVIVLVHSALI